MLLKITKDVIVRVNPCRWFSPGLIVGKILDDDGTFLTVTTPYDYDNDGKPLTLPTDCVEVVTHPLVLEEGTPPTHCADCGCLQSQSAVWMIAGRFVCHPCYAEDGGPCERYELDTETHTWVRTYPE